MALTWCLPNQASPMSVAVLKRIQREGAVVPAIWHIEMANILGLKVRDGFLSQRELEDALVLLQLLDIVTDEVSPRLDHLLPLMAEYRLAAYDTIYLDLAKRKNIVLATFDKEMREAARRNGIMLAN
jgi:predicted nucleic acid-binding protein